MERRHPAGVWCSNCGWNAGILPACGVRNTASHRDQSKIQNPKSKMELADVRRITKSFGISDLGFQPDPMAARVRTGSGISILDCGFWIWDFG
jgi:hypothetical protein